MKIQKLHAENKCFQIICIQIKMFTILYYKSIYMFMIISTNRKNDMQWKQ